MARPFLTVALILLTLAPAPADDAFRAGTTARVAMQSEADELILASFLKHMDGAIRRLTPEAVAKIEQVEDIRRIWSRYASMPLVAFQWTGDVRYLDSFVKGMNMARFPETKPSILLIVWHYGQINCGLSDACGPEFREAGPGHRGVGRRRVAGSLRLEREMAKLVDENRVLRIDKSRGAKVLIEVLGAEFDGVLGCDYFSVNSHSYQLQRRTDPAVCAPF